MRVLIADDERPARDELHYLLKQIEGIEVIGEAACGEEVLEQVRKLNPDVLFLDIQMPDASGIDIARQLFVEKTNPVIVFVTAFDQYAVEAFAVNAIDYLLKPIHVERLNETITRLNRSYEIMHSLSESDITQENDPHSQEIKDYEDTSGEYLRKLDMIYHSLNPTAHKLKIEENGKIYLIPSSDILYATIDERLVRVVTEQKSYLTNYTLSDLEGMLGPSFLRVHKSYLANVDKIESIVPWFNNTYNLIMKDRYEIPVSRTNVKSFRQRMGL
ncbi:LytR/AlgR family response regulator transcription factor [Desulfitobacterium metallireducens]|uniref:Stage 0 sporulation protein A homolog n=1 Tax=Desulfitobacterium metallireducens DSM 15288 TaxID=871968 RepID=W0E8Y5_9FIRM|nr:LytTR family DNA-binding domain-containing protein [Desulfitobacterium metallireducens]AHF07330.1 response regulator [Desulfitobacterium metallireducens DSM 15288]